jgi:hypothetical protein
MAAAANAFRAALGRIGFNAQTQDAMNENGFLTILDLTTVEEDDLDRLPKHLESWRDPDDDPADQVRVPFVSLKCLKAMRYWVLSQRLKFGILNSTEDSDTGLPRSRSSLCAS